MMLILFYITTKHNLAKSNPLKDVWTPQIITTVFLPLATLLPFHGQVPPRIFGEASEFLVKPNMAAAQQTARITATAQRQQSHLEIISRVIFKSCLQGFFFRPHRSYSDS